MDTLTKKHFKCSFHQTNPANTTGVVTMASGRNGSRRREPKGNLHDLRDDDLQQTALGDALQKAEVIPISKATKPKLIACANPKCNTKKRMMPEGSPWGVMTLINGTVGGVCGSECNEAYLRYKKDYIHQQFDNIKKEKGKSSQT